MTPAIRAYIEFERSVSSQELVERLTGYLISPEGRARLLDAILVTTQNLIEAQRSCLAPGEEYQLRDSHRNRAVSWYRIGIKRLELFLCTLPDDERFSENAFKLRKLLEVLCVDYQSPWFQEPLAHYLATLPPVPEVSFRESWWKRLD